MVAKAQPDNVTKEVLAVRVSRQLADAVRKIATADDECSSTVLRRLLKVGLASEQERRSVLR